YDVPDGGGGNNGGEQGSKGGVEQNNAGKNMIWDGLTDDDGEKKWKKWYQKGKYKTSITVLEGKVLLAKYDEKGAQYDDATELSGGESAEVKGAVE
nr:hypothetical protein [Candidatus Omnitrophota bacterium]